MIRVKNLNLAVGAFALCDVSLHVAPGEYFVLFGPSGAGKTLLLECLCGLNRIDAGGIFIDGEDATRLEPRRRRLGYLPQDYALFPHRTVRQNIAFGLEHRGLARRQIHQRVDHWMSMFNVGHLADRHPGRLSGGERQRVALARALAVEPAVLLLDEPVSALDEPMRDQVCRELKQLQRRTRVTTIHVGHSLAEMLATADRVGFVDGGRLVQVGTPRELLDRPKNSRVAQFVQPGNLFAADARTASDAVHLAGPGGARLRAAPSPGIAFAGPVKVMVRPEQFRVSRTAPAATAALACLEGTVSETADVGPMVRVLVACSPGFELAALITRLEHSALQLASGDRVWLSAAPEAVHVMDV